MMSAEDDLDLNEEIASMNLNLSSDLGQISSSSRSLSPQQQLKQSSNPPSLSAEEMNGTSEDRRSLDDKTSSISSGTHTPAELAAAPTTTVSKPNTTASSLFKGDDKDIFSIGNIPPPLAIGNIPPPLASRNLFGEGSSDDFLHTSALGSSNSLNQSSSFSIVSKDSSNSSSSFLGEQNSNFAKPNNATMFPQNANSNLISSFGSSCVKETSSPSKEITNPSFPNNQNNVSAYAHITPLTTPSNLSGIAAYPSTIPTASPYSLPQTNNGLSSPMYNPTNLNQSGVQGFNSSVQPPAINNPSMPSMSNVNNPYGNPHQLQNTSSSDPTFNINSPSAMQNYQTPGQSNLSTSTSSYNAVPSNPQNGMFIPSMYSSQTPQAAAETQSSFFVPTQPTETTSTMGTFNHTQPHVNSFNNSQSNNGSSTSQTSTHVKQDYNQGYNMDFQDTYQTNTTSNNNHNANGQGGGIWDWIKNTVNKDFKQQLKTATDSVLTTLDPGMEDYLNQLFLILTPLKLTQHKEKLIDHIRSLTIRMIITLDPGMDVLLKPCVHLGIANQDISIIHGVKEGFSKLHGTVDVKGQSIPQGNPMLPVGFEMAINSTTEALEYCTNVNFGFNTQYYIVSSKLFLAELVTDQWSAMVCLGLRDIQQNIIVHSFSQPIPLPEEMMQILYNRTGQKITSQQKSGYNVTIDEIVKMYHPYTNDEDWCMALTGGLPLHQIVFGAALCLASSHKRKIEKNGMYQASTYSTNYNQDMSSTQQHSYSSPYENQQQQQQQQQNSQPLQAPPLPQQQQQQQQYGSVVFNGF